MVLQCTGRSFRSERGRRETNQDKVLLSDCSVGGLPGVVLAVADGMGGLAEGEVAATIAIDSVQEFVQSVLPTLSPEPAVVRAGLIDLYQTANQRIHKHGQTQAVQKQLGSTLVTCIAFGGRYLVANVGDSRCYCLTNDGARQITRDHTHAQRLVEQGAMSPDAAVRSPLRHQLVNALGEADGVDVDVFPSHGAFVLDGEPTALLVCSDGLHGWVSPEEISETIHGSLSVEIGCDCLVRLAMQRQSPDNLSVAIAEFGGLARELSSTSSGPTPKDDRASTWAGRLAVGALAAALILAASAIARGPLRELAAVFSSDQGPSLNETPPIAFGSSGASLAVRGSPSARQPGQPPISVGTKPVADQGARPPALRLTELRYAEWPVVNAYVTVLDNNGATVSGLTASDFEVSVNGSTISAFEVSGVVSQGQEAAILLLIDKSGSMRHELRMVEARRAAIDFVNRSAAANLLMVATFDTKLQVLTAFGTDKRSLTDVLNKVEPGPGDTALRDALVDAAAIVAGHKAARHAIVLLTDGDDTRSVISVDESLARIKSVGVPIYAVALAGPDLGKDLEFLNRAGTETGGGLFLAPRSTELVRLYQAVANEIESQYVVRFRVPDRATSIHQLRVRVLINGITAEGARPFSPPESAVGDPRSIAIASVHEEVRPTGGVFRDSRTRTWAEGGLLAGMVAGFLIVALLRSLFAGRRATAVLFSGLCAVLGGLVGLVVAMW